MKTKVIMHEIFPFGQRLQHGVFFVAFVLAFVTGSALPGSGAVGRLAILFGGPDRLYMIHRLLGLAVGAALGGHLLYLILRMYIEDFPIERFPLLLSRDDWRRLARELPGTILGHPAGTGRYTPSRKLFYWLFLGGSATVTASGLLLNSWDRLDMSVVTSRLDALAAVHGGGAFVLAILVIWHVADILDGGRRLPMAVTIVSGTLCDADLAAFYPELHRLKTEEALGSAVPERDRDELTDDARQAERHGIEEILERGNRLARDGDPEGAMAAYREALDRYPHYSQAQYNLAVVLEKTGRSGEALEAYGRFLEIDPFHPLAGAVRKAVARLMEDRS
jgi:tetratricopeptide (TPR) repeat protein